MAKAQLSLIEERDENQRALGCVGLSAFAHVGLLIMILFAPTLHESAGIANGTKAGIELPGESMADTAPAGSAQITADSSAPVEVMLADASDANAVVAAPKAAKPVVESNDISSALTQARTEAAKNPTKSLKATAAPIQEAPVETSVESDVATPIAQTEAQEQDEASEDEQPVTASQDQEEEKEEAVPLQVALPESESLTQAQANALQSPNANLNTNAIPADAKPLETVQAVRSTSAPTGMIVTRPANGAPSATAMQASPAATRGLPGSNGQAGTASGMTQSRGGTQGIGVPAGAQVRDARSLEAMPGNPLATYPLPDRLANREGTTVLLGHVRNDGRIENITLEKSSGSRLMDQSAAKAFSQWKYKPGQEGYVRLPMQFKLVGDAHVIPAELNRR